MAESECSNGVNCSVNTSPNKGMRTVSSSNNICLHPPQAQGYVPVTAKGHKQSVYAMALNDTGTVLVSGGTEKVSLLYVSILVFLKNKVFVRIFNTLNEL